MPKLRVLVVDDEPGIRLSVQRTLGAPACAAGQDDPICFDVEPCASGAEGLARLQAGCPDVLLLDYRLPDMTGLELLGRLNGSRKQMLTILITGYALPDAHALAAGEGIYELLAKPFTPEELAASARRAAQHVLLQRMVAELTERMRSMRESFAWLLEQELDSTLDSVQTSMTILRKTAAETSADVLDRMLEVALQRTLAARGLISEHLSSLGQ